MGVEEDGEEAGKNTQEDYSLVIPSAAVGWGEGSVCTKCVLVGCSWVSACGAGKERNKIRVAVGKCQRNAAIVSNQMFTSITWFIVQ